MPEGAESRSALQELDVLLAQARRPDWLAKAKGAPGLAAMWLNRVRHSLARIYDASEFVERFPTIQLPISSAGGKEAASAALLDGIAQLEQVIAGIRAAPQRTIAPESTGKIFIGHGRSREWLVLNNFLTERLGLSCEEFNSESVAGVATSTRLMSMVEHSRFAFLVMTAEDQHADDTHHARENVIHEVGLFQARLGLERAIVLLEEGCSEFSNIHGLGQIRFPRGRISAAFEEIRQVLERELIISTQGPSSTPRPAPALSMEAKNLLYAAASGDGTILDVTEVGGRFLQANGTLLGGGTKSPRATAKWVAGLKELLRAGLVEDTSGTGQIYHVTELGYQVEEGQ